MSKVTIFGELSIFCAFSINVLAELESTPLMLLESITPRRITPPSALANAEITLAKANGVTLSGRNSRV
ncbi:hypothetical protein D3C72_1318200 [compost metagenome]